MTQALLVVGAVASARRCLRVLLGVLMALLVQQTVLAAPSRLSHFLPQITVDSVFPGADRVGPARDDLPVAPVYAGDKMLGHLYITSDFVNTRGYSSFPIDTLVALASDGTIMGAKLLEHHEPIVLIGIPQSKIEAFIRGYVGRNYVKNPPAPDAGPQVDIVSGATVTVMVIGDSIMRSAMLVAQRLTQAEQAPQAHSGGPVLLQERRVVNMGKDTVSDWKALLEQGAVARLRLTVGDVNKRLTESGHADAVIKDERPGDTYVDLYTALVSVPSIGRSLLGDAEYGHLKERLQPDQQAIVVAGNGSYSFKGSAYVRGGIFDRIEVVQGLQSFHFTDLNHERLGDVLAQGAPRFKEVALFTVPTHSTLDPVAPWRLQLLVQRAVSDNNKAFVSFNLNYELPGDYTRMIAQAPPKVAQTQAGAGTGTGKAAQAAANTRAPAAAAAAAAVAGDTSAPTQLWKHMWQAKRVQIAVLLVALAILATAFFFQNTFTLNERRFGLFRTGFLIFSVVWLGWYASAQLSVVNVLTFVHALRGDFRWEYFLMDPMVFILWVATAVSILFWNRGAFCGWLCPFGALQELLNKLARRLHVPQLSVPYGVGSRLATLKYVIFLGLFGVSFYDMALAERLAEIEPFKTAIILKFVREWGFVIFALAWILPGLFIERFYCRYVCPLGAGLAIPARMRMFNWLKRYRECGNPCQLCAVECPVQAIAPDGEIQPNECIQCLNCQVLYHSEARCPHVIQVTKRRQRNKPAPVQGSPVAPALPAAASQG